MLGKPLGSIGNVANGTCCTLEHLVEEGKGDFFLSTCLCSSVNESPFYLFQACCTREMRYWTLMA